MSHNLALHVHLPTEREWLDPPTSLSYLPNSDFLIGDEQINNKVVVNSVDWHLKLGVITNQLSALLD